MENKLTYKYINDSVRDSVFDFVGFAEDRFSAFINSVTDNVASDGKHKAIMLAGPSASGKTTSAKMIVKSFNKHNIESYFISLDDFYNDADRAVIMPDGSPDYESVHCLDIGLIVETLNRLITEGESDIPIFDFTKGRRSEYNRHIKMKPDDVIIVEGLHALNPLITAPLPAESVLKTYISVSSGIYDELGNELLTGRDLRFIRRLIRDYKFRSSSVENTYMLWTGVVRGEDEFLYPFKNHADIKINSIHPYEPCIFKNSAIELLSELHVSSKHKSHADNLIKRLEIFNSISEITVPSTSLLREFIG